MGLENGKQQTCSSTARNVGADAWLGVVLMGLRADDEFGPERVIGPERVVCERGGELSEL